ncbi:MAG: nuclear transport factor 2 family protein [Chloroflexota bacterium]|nr:nuclear transport factor 2 family protein [Chloroflexota bacterium]
MRRTVPIMGIVALLALLILPAGAVFAQAGDAQGAQDPVAVVTAFINASKSKNYDLAMTYFAENATITNNASTAFGGPAETYTTGSQIRSQFVETAPGDLQVLSMQASGNTVTIVLRTVEGVEGGAGSGSGITHIDYMVTFTVVNGKIQTGTLDLTPESRAAIQVIASGPGGPGMPRTGNGDQNALLLSLTLLAILVVVLGGTGVFLVRRSAAVR